MVAIVGRPNVGKSSLLNCLAGRRISIVDATPGVTRDRISVPVALGDTDEAGYIELVDTGGMGIEDHDDLTEDVEDQIRFGMKTADLILFVVDAREGIVSLDQHVARALRRMPCPVLLVANKIDQANVLSELGELNALGFGDPIPVSAAHNDNMYDLLDAIREQVGSLSGRPHDEGMRLAIVGKRNAGKSTLINALAGEDRVIVSEKPGTTRDSVDVQLELDGQRVTLIDTAGVKRRGKIATDIEYYSQHRAMRSVRRADVVALMIDASLPVSQVDKNLAGIIHEEYKPVMIVVNKWDLSKGNVDTEEYAEYFSKMFPELRYAPIAMTTATESINVHETIGLARQIYDQSQQRVTTGQLNSVMEHILAERGPSHRHGTKPPKIFYTSQVSVGPPTIVCICNDTRSFDTNYKRFLINRLRDYLPYSEVPIRLFFRSRRGERKSTTLPRDKETDSVRE